MIATMCQMLLTYYCHDFSMSCFVSHVFIICTAEGSRNEVLQFNRDCYSLVYRLVLDSLQEFNQLYSAISNNSNTSNPDTINTHINNDNNDNKKDSILRRQQQQHEKGKFGGSSGSEILRNL